MDAIYAKNLCFDYGDDTRHIIRNLNVNIPSGSITAILGPNGCGKTTLMYLFMGILSPCSGKILFFGKNRNTYEGKKAKQMIGIVPQNETVPFDLNLLEFVLLGRAPYLHPLELPGISDREIARTSIKSVGLELMMHRFVPSLSSGERQLASIARSLTHNPQILLLDEPTSHLDLVNSRRILRVMKHAAGKGCTVIFTTHDPNAASAIADHVLLFGSKSLVSEGCTSETLTQKFLSEAYGEKIEVIKTTRGTSIIVL